MVFYIPLLGFATLPDNSGNVFQEPAAVTLESNDLYPNLPYAFPDTGTLLKLGFVSPIPIPSNYNPAPASIQPKIGMGVATTATSGAWRQKVDYTAIAPGETWDPAAAQESVAATITVPGTARLLAVVEIALTPGNIVAGDILKGVIQRDGSNGGDTLAATLYLVGPVYFSYSDV